MLKCFRGKGLRDTEKASETIISSSSFISNSETRIIPKSTVTVTDQLQNGDNFETFIEKIK